LLFSNVAFPDHRLTRFSKSVICLFDENRAVIAEVGLAGSIRDDGPLPEVIGNVYEAQSAMRVQSRQATTVITLATQLHSIAFGNMLPSYHVTPDGNIRPIYFYIVDMSEFSAAKLANRGSSQSVPILTNVQDFMINLWNNLARKEKN
jgi:hypothetical protein